jgi:hypothetical protein
MCVMPEMRMNSLKSRAMKLRAVVRDDSRLRFRVLLLGSLQNHLDVGFSHGLPEIPMHEETAEPIQNAAQVIEGAAQVDGKRRYASPGAAGGWPGL